MEQIVLSAILLILIFIGSTLIHGRNIYHNNRYDQNMDSKG